MRRLVAAHAEAPLLGIFGAPRVNVLALNLALDELPGQAVHTETLDAEAAPRP